MNEMLEEGKRLLRVIEARAGERLPESCRADVLAMLCAFAVVEDMLRSRARPGGNRRRSMSLDVWLEGEPEVVECTCGKCGNVHFHETRPMYFEANITHNLNTMAMEAGIYGAVWRPDENGITTAQQLIEPLRQGIERLTAEPDRFRAFEPSNGWGEYGDFIPWLRKYMHACEDYPLARVRVSR